MRVFLKNMRKSLWGGIAPPALVSLLVPIMAGVWPSFKEQAAYFAEMLKSPIYRAMLGQLGLIDISTWNGVFYMYVGVTLEWAIVFVAIFIPVRLITREVDKGTLDVMLSYPIPRWRYLLERFGVYLTYNALYPAFIYALAVVCTNSMGETMDFAVLSYVMLGAYLQLFALGALSLLCGAVFLESGRALAASGAVVLVQYVMTRLGDLGPLDFLKDFTLFNYMSTGTIMSLGSLPTNELTVLVGAGLAALTLALLVFQRRELTY